MNSQKSRKEKDWCFWTMVLASDVCVIPWTDKITNKHVLQRVGPVMSLEAMFLQQKLRYFGHVMRHEGMEKTIMLGIGRRCSEAGKAKDEVSWWSKRSHRNELRKVKRENTRQNWLAYICQKGHQESDTTEWINYYYVGVFNELCHDWSAHLSTLSVRQIDVDPITRATQVT